jgi:hypothetical protein
MERHGHSVLEYTTEFRKIVIIVGYLFEELICTPKVFGRFTESFVKVGDALQTKDH